MARVLEVQVRVACAVGARFEIGVETGHSVSVIETDDHVTGPVLVTTMLKLADVSVHMSEELHCFVASRVGS